MDGLSTLQRLANGRFIEDINEGIEEVAAQVVLTGKPGFVSITLKITKEKGEDGWVGVEESISKRPPKKGSRGALFFSYEGELHKGDPRQTQLPEFRAVDDESEVRKTDDPGKSVREA